MASINPYAEGKEHILFVYDATYGFPNPFLFDYKSSGCSLTKACVVIFSTINRPLNIMLLRQLNYISPLRFLYLMACSGFSLTRQ